MSVVLVNSLKQKKKSFLFPVFSYLRCPVLPLAHSGLKLSAQQVHIACSLCIPFVSLAYPSGYLGFHDKNRAGLQRTQCVACSYRFFTTLVWLYEPFYAVQVSFSLMPCKGLLKQAFPGSDLSGPSGVKKFSYSQNTLSSCNSLQEVTCKKKEKKKRPNEKLTKRMLCYSVQMLQIFKQLPFKSVPDSTTN